MNTLSGVFLDVHRLAKNWCWVLTFGILLLILGLGAISASVFTTFVTVLFLGILLTISGVLVVIHAFTNWWHQWGGFFLTLIVGILYTVFGLMLVAKPILGAIVITPLLATLFIILGIFRIIAAVSHRLPSWGWALLNGIITTLLGIFIFLQWPVSGMFIIGLFVGIEILISGLYLIMLSCSLKRLKGVIPAQRET